MIVGRKHASLAPSSASKQVSVRHEPWPALCSRGRRSPDTCCRTRYAMLHSLINGCLHKKVFMQGSWEWLTLWHNFHHTNMGNSNRAQIWAQKCASEITKYVLLLNVCMINNCFKATEWNWENYLGFFLGVGVSWHWFTCEHSSTIYQFYFYVF